MENWPVNPVDLLFVAVMLVSAALAFMRGFVKEVLAVAAWIGAAVATLQLFPPIQPFARRQIDTPFLADAVVGAGLFIVVLIVLSAISHGIAARVRESRINAVDRSLGFVFGLVRGAAVLVVVHLLLGWIIPPRDQPVWVREARVVPLLEWGGDLMLQLVPPADRPRRERTAAPPPPPQPQPLPKATPRPSAPVDTTADSAGETGYKTDERRALENLIRGQPNE